ncbi:MAG TPA: hypothetical protein VIY56_10140 [Vicinamibacterales bacterium]
MKSTVFACALSICLLGVTTLAQWPKHSPAGVPVASDGKVDMNAPTPRTADGKPDLSGVWETFVPRRPAPAAPSVAATGTGEGPPPGIRSLFFNIGSDIPSGVAPYQPWAEELMKKRRADNSKDNPDALCLPMGIMQMTTHPFPRKIIQTPREVIVIYEGSGTTVRELFMDGRSLPPKDVEPWWNGYSVARWEGDTLVAETTGLMDDGWLDVQGSPLTSAAKLTERFRRTNYGTLEIEVTIDDPKAYTRPFTATVHNRLLPDTQLIEFVCIEKSGAHYVGADGKPSPTK